MGDVEVVSDTARGKARRDAAPPRALRRVIGASALAIVVILVALVSLTGSAAGSSPSPFATADVQAGGSVYAGNCAACHGPKGQGGIGPTLAAAAFPTMVADKVRVGGGGMPAFQRKLSATDIDNVSVFVARRIADPAAGKASVAAGADIYLLYCGGCHSGSGRGGALLDGPNAPSLQGRPAANVLAAVVIGPRNMPVFTGALDVTQQASVARYVQAALTPPASPGGWGLGFIGPVIEGVVSWLGLLVLILIAVWLAWKKGVDVRDRA